MTSEDTEGPRAINLHDHDDLEFLLTNSNPVGRCMGRLLATGAMAEIEKWINAEEERGTKDDVVIQAMIQNMGSVLGSRVVSCVSPRGDAQVIDLVAEAIRRHMTNHVAIVRHMGNDDDR